MEPKSKRFSRSTLKGGSSYSRRNGNRNKDSCFNHSINATEAIEKVGTSKNALRERTRVESLRKAYLELQAAIPSVPPNTKLSKLDVLMLATTYISHLTQLLQEDDDSQRSHDDNNNDTRYNGASNGHGEANLLQQNTASQRVPQRGLLHPVKKWPMRARLYTDVGAAEASPLTTDQVKTYHHHHHHHHILSKSQQTVPTSQSPNVQELWNETSNQRFPVSYLQCNSNSPVMAKMHCHPYHRDHQSSNLGIQPEVCNTHRQKTPGATDNQSFLEPNCWAQNQHCHQRSTVSQQCIPISGYTDCSENLRTNSNWDSHLNRSNFIGCQAQCQTVQPINENGSFWSTW